ncbi:hypothetical protein D9611_004535 [Ephemerocybe angulata]|uniref:Uncharacterized protein n=1 Tax=Ephemerocybe angulata TaxID=980116 RepID=A0A8H5F5X6_9AGAR|nr:hypothetical protein D9611_004535 [Tulosesus angulatus]
MPRRAPPSALRLVPGPTPERGSPKHSLPSLPRPIHTAPSTERLKRSPSSSGMIAVTPPANTSRTAPTARLRGPWDHSESVGVVIDVSLLLAPLQPAVVTSGRQTV